MSAAATWFLRTVSTRVQRRFRDKVTIALESHVAQLQASVATVAHQERPEYLDRLSMLRNQVFVLDHMYVSLFSTSGGFCDWASPWRCWRRFTRRSSCLLVFAVPTVLTSTWRPAVERNAQERGAQTNRLARHCSPSPPPRRPARKCASPASESGSMTDRRAAWERGIARGERALGLGAVARASMGNLRLRVCRRRRLRIVWDPRAGQHVLLVLAAGARLSAYIGATVGEIGFLRGFWMDGSRRLAWLEDYAASVAASRRSAGSSALQRGIRFDHVSFAYPGTSRVVLDDVSLTLPAGAVVAIVGENGAGKTTLVKLLAKMYEPSSGAIFVDDTPLARVPADEWRARLAGAFQDFFRFEFRASHTVGLGDVPRLDDRPAVVAARRSRRRHRRGRPSGLAGSIPNSAPRGRAESSCRSASGRSSRWRVASCASSRCCWSWTNPPQPWTQKPNTHCSSATPQPRATPAIPAAASPSWSRTVSRPSAWPISSSYWTAPGWLRSARHDELMAKRGQYSELYGIQAAAYR